MVVLLNEYICALRKKSVLVLWGHNKMYTPRTIGNSKTDRASTKIKQNGAVVKVRILVELGMYINLAAISGAMLKY